MADTCDHHHIAAHDNTTLLRRFNCCSDKYTRIQTEKREKREEREREREREREFNYRGSFVENNGEAGTQISPLMYRVSSSGKTISDQRL